MVLTRYSRPRALAGCCCLLLLAALISGAQAAPKPVANLMELAEAYPDTSTAMRAVKNNDKELAAYLSDPETVCTFFVPNNQAMADWMRWFGKYAGKAVQNETFMHSALNYHVVPGKALTADDVAKGGRVLTRANETVYFWKSQGKPYVYSRADYPNALNRTNIKAGGCLVHTINMALVPPTSNDMVEAWVDEIGTRPPPLPKSAWAPATKPLPESLEAAAASGAGAAADAPAAADSKAAAVAPAPAAGKPATSSSSVAAVSGAAGLALASAIVLAAVGL